MARFVRIALAWVLALSLVGGAGCQRTAEVRTGTKVVCTYGHPISENIKTVKVPARDVGKYRVRTVTRTCARHLKMEALYRDAQSAIAGGKLAEAAKLLGQVVAIDPQYAKAQEQIAAIDSGKKPVPDTGTGSNTGSKPATSTPGKPGEDDTSVPSGSLLKWAPDTLTGYTAQKPTIDAINIAREYVPASGSQVFNFVIVAEEARTSAGAKAALTSQVKSAHPQDASTVSFNGHSAYFGTDGRRFAALGFTSGSVMVALQMATAPGKDPATLKDEIIAAAKQLP